MDDSNRWRGDSVIAELGALIPKEVLALGAAGISTVRELLDRVPKRYEDRRRFDSFPTQASSTAVCLRGMVTDAGRSFFSRGGMTEVVIQAANDAGFGENSLTCRWFNAPYISKLIAVGQELILYGKPKDLNGKLVIDHPEFEVIKEGESDQQSVHVERIVPVYKNVSGIAQRRLREIMFLLLERVSAESLNGEFCVDESYPRMDAYREVHFPCEMEQVEAARRYFALEEFVNLQLEVMRRRRKYQQQKGRVQGVKMNLLTAFYKSLPFDLTGAQKRCIKEVIHDMRSELPMNRMLQGDVGSGKTFVALCAALLAVDSGAQVALMAPTQILAEQHYLTFRKWLDPLQVRVGLVTSDRAEEGQLEWSKNPQILIGTHALLYGENTFNNLGMVIIDEQHKFGVEQRGRLVQRNARCSGDDSHPHPADLNPHHLWRPRCLSDR